MSNAEAEARRKEAFSLMISGKATEWIINQPFSQPPLTGSAMDFGCGTGNLSFKLIDCGGLQARIFGVDVNAKSCDQFRKKAAQVGLGDRIFSHNVELTGPDQLAASGGPPDGFDLIYSLMTFHHLKKPDETAAILALYLKPGGRLIILDVEATANAEHFHPAGAKLFEHYHSVGVAATEARCWLEAAGLSGIDFGRTPFHKVNTFGEMEEFSLLAVTAVKPSLADGATAISV
ncbi:unnamed protein product [Phaeothamnion confervicola]